MSRKKKLILNTITGVLKQVIMVICGFVLPRYMLLYYGSAVNGMVASITNWLGFISLLDMGVGSVIQANLYKPLADQDSNQISRIVVSSDRFFRRLAYIFIIYIAVLCIVIPLSVNSAFSPWYSVTLLVIISISTLAQYLFGMTYQILLNADQKAYVPLALHIITIILNTVFSIILMKMGASIHLVKLMTAVVFVLRPLGQILYVRKHYSLNKKITVVGEPIKQKWNGFSQHLAGVITQNIDIVVLNLLSTLENVSVYSVYYNVAYGIEQVVFMASTGLDSLFGNMIAVGEKDRLLQTFNTIEWIIHTVVSILFTITGITIVPFIVVYTRGINDADYIAPVFAAILVMSYACRCLRVPYFKMIKSAGHFRETQNGAYISAVLNIVITVVLVSRFGLIGAASGTLVAMLYHTCYLVWYLRRNILQRSFSFFIKYLIVDAVVVLASVFVTNMFSWAVCDSYFSWAIYAAKVSAIVLTISAIINITLNKQRIVEAYGLLKK